MSYFAAISINTLILGRNPGSVMIAEESTAWPKVTGIQFPFADGDKRFVCGIGGAVFGFVCQQVVTEEVTVLQKAVYLFCQVTFLHAGRFVMLPVS